MKLAIEKGLKNNLSRESIFKNIYGIQKDKTTLEYFEFEVVAPENVKLIVTGLTDNNNRTIANLKGYLNKFQGQITKINAIKPYFQQLGIFHLPAQEKMNEEAILNVLIDFPLEHLLIDDKGAELHVLPFVFYQVQTALEKANYRISEAEICWMSIEKINPSLELQKNLFVWANKLVMMRTFKQFLITSIFLKNFKKFTF